jgi:hypothetical protein
LPPAFVESFAGEKDLTSWRDARCGVPSFLGRDDARPSN